MKKAGPGYEAMFEETLRYIAFGAASYGWQLQYQLITTQVMFLRELAVNTHQV